MARKIAATAAALALVVLGVSACEKQLKAPDVQGECYFIGHPADGKPTFNAIAHDQPDIEHCAVFVYNARTEMLKTGTAGEVTEGAYNRNYLWVTNREVKMSQTYEGPRYPLLVKVGNKLVQPGAIVEEEPVDNQPRTVEIPKDLPQKAADGKVVTGQ